VRAPTCAAAAASASSPDSPPPVRDSRRVRRRPESSPPSSERRRRLGVPSDTKLSPIPREMLARRTRGDGDGSGTPAQRGQTVGGCGPRCGPEAANTQPSGVVGTWAFRYGGGAQFPHTVTIPGRRPKRWRRSSRRGLRPGESVCRPEHKSS
jgi:hypothetical protein